MDHLQTFGELFSDLVTLSGYTTVRRVAGVLNDNGVEDIDFRRVSDYMKGTRVPKHKKAASILRALDYEISDMDLEDLLDYSRDESRKTNMELADMRSRLSTRAVYIDFSKLMEGFESEEAKLLMNNRIVEIYGDEKNASRYVNDLIRKDLEEYILESEVE